MQDQNHRQDRMTLKLTTLIFILCFLGPVVYSLVTGKCLFTTCAQKLENLKGIVAEKGKALTCPFSASKEQLPAQTCSVKGNISPVDIKPQPPAQQSVLPAESSDAPIQAKSQTAAIDEDQKKTFNISG